MTGYGVGVINLVMSENNLGRVFQMIKKRVAIGSHELLMFSLSSRLSSL